MSNRELKNVSFGKKDEELLEFLEDKGQFSRYVKQLIREEMERIEEAKKPKFVPIQQSTDEKIDEILEILKSGKLKLSDDKDTTEETDTQTDELELSEGQKNALAESLSFFSVTKV